MNSWVVFLALELMEDLVSAGICQAYMAKGYEESILLISFLGLENMKLSTKNVDLIQNDLLGRIPRLLRKVPWLMMKTDNYFIPFYTRK